MKPTLNDINAILPQTQCGECGFPGCLPYAQALQAHQTDIGRCPPGGVETLSALGQLFHIDPSPYLKDVANKTRPPSIARINEVECIGCTKCIQACPVDAIFGTAKHMHVIIPQDCTGCGLCIEPCPVDCIEMVEIPAPLYNKAQAKTHFEAKQQRQLRERIQQEQHYQTKRQLTAQSEAAHTERSAKKTYIQEALERAARKKP